MSGFAYSIVVYSFTLGVHAPVHSTRCAALREFSKRPAGATHGPSIVGFREHIFSGIGLLGDLAASSELCFGTLAQACLPDSCVWDSCVWDSCVRDSPD